MIKNETKKYTDSADMHDVEVINLDLKNSFSRDVIANHAVTNVILNENTNLGALAEKSGKTITAIDPKDNIQLMLAAQMTSVHAFQQKMMHFASNTTDSEIIVKYLNVVTKLSNVFIQQVSLMHKLKIGGEKKLVFKQIDIHKGAQAIVGVVHSAAIDQPQGSKN